MRRLLSVLLVSSAALISGACSNGPQPAPVPVIPPSFPTDTHLRELQASISELTDRLDVMNARMQKLESGAAPPPRVVEAPPAPAAAPRSAAAPSSPTAPGTDRVRSANIADQYRKALTLYGQNRVEDARKIFLQILEAEPSGELADNALYWLGETYFARSEYAEAMKHYRRVVSDYPEQNKAPDAMLKIGLAYAKLGDLSLARTTFHQLIEAYPYSTPASTARVELKRIKY